MSGSELWFHGRGAAQSSLLLIKIYLCRCIRPRYALLKAVWTIELITQTSSGTALVSISEQRCTSPVSEKKSLVAWKFSWTGTVWWRQDLWLRKAGLLARGREQRGGGGSVLFLVKGHFTACCYHNNRLQRSGGGEKKNVTKFLFGCKTPNHGLYGTII